MSYRNNKYSLFGGYLNDQGVEVVGPELSPEMKIANLEAENATLRANQKGPTMMDQIKESGRQLGSKASNAISSGYDSTKLGVLTGINTAYNAPGQIYEKTGNKWKKNVEEREASIGKWISAVLLISCVVICIDFWYANIIWTNQLPKDDCDKCSNEKVGGVIPGMACTLICGIMCGWATGRFFMPFIIKKLAKDKSRDDGQLKKGVVIGITFIPFFCCFFSMLANYLEWDNKGMGMGLSLLI